MAHSEQRPDVAARGGARRAAKPTRRLQPRLVGLTLSAILALVGWAALVWVAVHFGRDARGGDSAKWVYLAVASVGAVGCLFLCLWLFTLLLRRVGILAGARQPAQPHRH